MQCPSCDLRLRTEFVGEETLERCESCGGEFCARQALRRLIVAHAPPPGSHPVPYARPSPLSDPVRYRKCPACGDMMTRRNFRGSSGIVVDVCSSHGVWFDGGELGKVFEFVETGAMAIADRNASQRAEDRRRLDAFERNLRNAGPRHYIGITAGMAGPVDWIPDIWTLLRDPGDG